LPDTGPALSEATQLPAGKTPSREGMFAAFEVAGYRRLWLSGCAWNLARWMSLFLVSYMVNRLTGAPLLVQLVGTALFAPMFLGGAIGGVISDRFDRRRTILLQNALLAPFALLIAAVVLAGEVRVWMVYPFMLAMGVGGVIDMTCRRALIFEFVGERRLTNALAMESLSMTGGSMLGSALGGTVIDAFGLGATFALMGALLGGAFLLLLGVVTPARTFGAAVNLSFLRELSAGFRFVRGHRALISILGVTVLMNLFYFSFIPMAPVFAERMGVGALWVGILAGANGFGSMLGTLVQGSIGFGQ